VAIPVELLVLTEPLVECSVSIQVRGMATGVEERTAVSLSVTAGAGFMAVLASTFDASVEKLIA